jgi:hypothetical protein
MVRRRTRGRPAEAARASEAQEISMSWQALKDVPPWEWPEDAAKILLGVLLGKGTSDADRRLAVELAGNFTAVDDELAEALLSTLRSGENSAEVRSRAAISLGPVLEHGDTAGFGDVDDAPISEETYRRLRESMVELYRDASVPKEVRRRILEASVRAPQPWHQDAVRAAYASDDAAWKLTAVFCMSFVPGFDRSILEALDSEDDDIHREAIAAACERELDGAWPHVAALLSSPDTEKRLLLAAIEAAATIRPREAAEALLALADSEDEEVAAAVGEALAMAEGLSAQDE